MELHDDRHNTALLRHVRPPEWTNPEPVGRYNLVVLGGGTAGLVSAIGAAMLGARVALVERQLLGGDCLNWGCVPSKALLAAARRAKAAGRSGPEAFTEAMDEVRRLRSVVGEHDSAKRLADAGVDVFFGDACFVDKDVVIVDGTPLKFRKAVIATGTRPEIPKIQGLAQAPYLTNETVFELTELPRRLLVLGGGPIGCELAQAFARLGSIVTVFEQAARVLPGEDADASRAVAEALKSDGVTLELSASVVRVEGTSFVLGDGREPAGDAVLVATGRTPNIDALGLTSAGVSFDGRTGLVVDDRFRTTNRRIVAAGDVASTAHRFSHSAYAMARGALINALLFGRQRASRLVHPRCTYTSPEVAHVGMSAAEAEAAGDKVVTLTEALEHVDRAIVEGTTDGFARVHVDRRTGRVLGATMVAPHAGEAIGEMSVAVTNRLTLEAIGRSIHPYPTVAEAWKKLADQHEQRRLKPKLVALLARWFRLTRWR